MTRSPFSPLLREQADALTLFMEIRRAAEHALRAGKQGAALEANFIIGARRSGGDEIVSLTTNVTDTLP